MFDLLSRAAAGDAPSPCAPAASDRPYRGPERRGATLTLWRWLSAALDEIDYGIVLVGANGMTLCTFDRDAAGSCKSVCNGPCAARWPPLAAASEAEVRGLVSEVYAQLNR